MTIRGRKAGGSASPPPTPRTPVESPNSLRARATGRIVFAIGEGPTVGPAEWTRSVFFNGTPWQNQDGSFNFPGITWDVRTGTPDQTHMPGFPAVESEVSVEVPITVSQPHTRFISNPNANAVRVKIALPQIFEQNTQTGDVTGAAVAFSIDVRRNIENAGWLEHHQTIDGKQTSTYQRAYRIELPDRGLADGWQVRVRRLSPDSDRSALQNSTVWASYTEIIDHKFRYPSTALVGLTFDAEHFGNQIPRVTYDWKGWIVDIPSNYDGEARTYSSPIWDGTFKKGWTDNPVWNYRALLLHPRGAGLHPSQVDSWQLYTIAQYCDQLVPDGFGGFEPRFSCNAAITTRQEAYAVLSAMASSFRAMTYWASGAVNTVADMPADPEVLVTRANTIGGFEYSGAGLKAIHTAAIVSYLDAEQNYERVPVVYENSRLVDKYGYNTTEVTAFACTSRSQAYRLGKWLVETEAAESESLTWKASLDHLNVVPGMIAEVQDPDIAGLRMGGRVAGGTAGSVLLDASVAIESGKTYTLRVVTPDGAVHQRGVMNGAGTHTLLTLGVALPAAPVPESPWVLTASDLAPQLYRILAITEDNPGEYTVAAVRHDPGKYARVELGVEFNAPPISRLPNPGIVQPPTNLRIDRQYISTPGGWTIALQLSWDASPDAYVRGYVVRWQRDDGNWQERNETSSTTLTLYGESHGKFVFHVQAVNFAGVMSRPAVLDLFIPNNSPITLVRPSGLELEGQGLNTVFSGRDPKFQWRGTALRGAYPLGEEPAAGAGYLDAIFRDYEVRVVAPNGQIVFVDHTTLTHYTFGFEKNAGLAGGPYRAFKFVVLMRDKWGNLSQPAEIEVSNPPPALPTNLQVRSGLGSIAISFDRPSDLDWSGTLVWVGETSGFTPSAANQRYDGRDTFVFLLEDAQGVTRYVRVALYDDFGKTGLNVTSELAVLISSVSEPDTLPPAAPTGLTLSSRVATNNDGTKIYTLQANWSAATESDFSHYVAGIRVAGASQWLESTVGSTPRWDWSGVLAGVTYEVRVRAFDSNGNWSVESSIASHTITGDSTPPSAHTRLTAIGAFRTVWLETDKPPERDYLHTEVWAAATNDRSQASLVVRAHALPIAIENIPAGETRYFWIRAVDRSFNMSEWFPVSATGGIAGKTRKVEEADYQELSIVNAFIKDATIDDAKIFSIDAKKIKADSVLASTVRVGSESGVTIGDIATGGTDPAGGINSGTTLIDPGKIRVAGGITLADWRGGPDLTQINGGFVSANSIDANKLTIGNRALSIIGLEFTPQKEFNIVSWTAGIIAYPENGATVSENIEAAAVQYGGGFMVLFWQKGTGQIRVSYDPGAVNANPNNVVMATYTGSAQLNAFYGRTIIDGPLIRTGAITADKIKAREINADHLTVSGAVITNQAQIGGAVINSTHIGSAQINDAHINDLSAGKIRTGFLRSDTRIIAQAPGQTGYAEMDGQIGYFRVVDNQNPSRQRVLMGHRPGIDYGLWIWDVNGNEIISANGLGLSVVGRLQVNGRAIDTDRLEFNAASSSNGAAHAGGSSVADWVNHAQISLTTIGGPVFVMASCRVSGNTATDQTVTSGDWYTGTQQSGGRIRILRDYGGTSTEIEPPASHVGSNGTISVAVRDTPPAGTSVYTLQFSAVNYPDAGSGSSGRNFLYAVEMRR